MLLNVHCSTHSGHLSIIARWFPLFPKYALKVAYPLFDDYFSLLPPFFYDVSLCVRMKAAPRGAGGYGGQHPPGPATTPTPGNQPLLPSIHETDMSIQADPRVMRMTVGAIPNSSTAHAQVILSVYACCCGFPGGQGDGI